MLKEHDGGPVIAEVLRERAGGAGAALSNVPGHGRVEGIPADDLVEMGGGHFAGLHDGIEPLDGQCGAAESKGSFGLRREGENEGEVFHSSVGGLMLVVWLGGDGSRWMAGNNVQ